MTPADHPRTTVQVALDFVDLPRAVREGRFRDDLFYRLRVVPITISPLRQRREDIQPLAQVILARVNARHGRALRFSPDALRALLEHDWPGNVRELENVIEYAVTVCHGQTILPEDLPALSLLDPADPEPGRGVTDSISLAPIPTSSQGVEARTEVDRATLHKVLEAHHWRRSEAARALGVSRTTLWRRMRDAALLGASRAEARNLRRES